MVLLTLNEFLLSNFFLTGIILGIFSLIVMRKVYVGSNSNFAYALLIFVLVDALIHLALFGLRTADKCAGLLTQC